MADKLVKNLNLELLSKKKVYVYAYEKKLILSQKWNKTSINCWSFLKGFGIKRGSANRLPFFLSVDGKINPFTSPFEYSLVVITSETCFSLKYSWYKSGNFRQTPHSCIMAEQRLRHVYNVLKMKTSISKGHIKSK